MPEPKIVNTSAVQIREFVREVFLKVLDEASIQRAFDRHIGYERGVLRVGEDLYDLSQYEKVFVVSIGKAGHTMVEALTDKIGHGVLEGIVVCPVDPPMQPGFRYFRGGHPFPNGESLRAGAAVLRALESQTAASLVIFMISGGASALCEMPISDDITLEDLIATYKVLVHSGAPIAEINAIRKHLSALKGGRMAQAALPARQVAIMISDVPEGKLDSLASGPTLPDTTTVAECYELARRYGMIEAFPPPVRRMFEQGTLEETPKPGDATFANTRFLVISSNEMALHSAAEILKEAGFEVLVDNTCDDWDYVAAADYLLDRLHELQTKAGRACVVSGGEVTVKVVNGGIGGRNQQLALYCATRIAGEKIAVLSAGTDGIDGNSPAAGAVTDGTSMERALALDLSPIAALGKFDVYPLFEKTGDAIMTGPTGNNVRDLRLLLAW